MNVSNSSLRRSRLSPLARHSAYRRKPSKRAPSLEALEVRLVLSTTWVQQGPGPIINAQEQGITSALGANPVSGAISQVAVGSTSDILYVASVNGGVWKTTNATAATPSWVPLTDNASLAQPGQFPSLSTQSIALSPLNANTLFAGSGRVSSIAQDGGAQFGIARSTDGGATWTVAGPTGVNIPSVIATQATVGGNEVILAGTSGGVYRSIDGGSTYSQITVGVPAGNVTNLVGDSGVSTRFYAAVDGSIYTSNDTGATWTADADTGFNSAFGDRVLLSVHHDANNDDIFAMDISGSTSNLSGVYRSTDQGATWTSLGVPVSSALLHGQGYIHGAILADATDPTSVYISGDSSTDQARSGVIYHYVSGAWQAVYGTGANGTAPHADSRSLFYDQTGNVLYTGDGGIFKLNNPTSTSLFWSSLDGTIATIEAHSAAYDPVSKVFVAGAQDNGSSNQTATGSSTWSLALGGDGGDVQVDANQTAHPGTSIRYLGFQFSPAGQYRVTYNANNNNVSGYVAIGFNIISGAGAGQTIKQFDNTIQFYNPYTLNRINPARMLIGTSYIYESLNQGDSVANLVNTGNTVGDNLNNNPLSYGGLNGDGSSNPGSFYVGSGSTIYHRSADGSPIVTLGAYPGGKVDALVSDPKNVAHIFVLDANNQVWRSFDEGATWANLTVNLGTLSPSLRTIEIFSPTNTPLNTVLLVGGEDGVFQMRRPSAAGASWTPVATGLPKGVLVYDLRYEYTQNVLTIGTGGRGVWSLSNYFRGGVTVNPGVALAPSGPGGTGGGTSVINVPSQPTIAVPVSHSPPQNPSPSSFKAIGNPLTFIGTPAVSTLAVSAFATDDLAPPVSSVSTVIDGPAGLFTPRRTRKPVAQSQGDIINPFGSSLLN